MNFIKKMMASSSTALVICLITATSQCIAQTNLIADIVSKCQKLPSPEASRQECYQVAIKDACKSKTENDDEKKCYNDLYQAVGPDYFDRVARARSCVDADLADEMQHDCREQLSNNKRDSNAIFKCYSKSIAKGNVKTTESKNASVLFAQAADQSSFLLALSKGCSDCDFAKNNSLAQKTVQALNEKYNETKCGTQVTPKGANETASPLAKFKTYSKLGAGDSTVVRSLLSCVQDRLAQKTMAAGAACPASFEKMSDEEKIKALNDKMIELNALMAKDKKPTASSIKPDTLSGQVVQFFNTVRKYLVSDLGSGMNRMSGDKTKIKNLAENSSCTNIPQTLDALKKLNPEKTSDAEMFSDESILKIISSAQKAKKALNRICANGFCYVAGDSKRFADKMHAATSLGRHAIKKLNPKNANIQAQLDLLDATDLAFESREGFVGELNEALRAPYLALGYESSIATGRGVFNWHAGLNGDSFPMVSKIYEVTGTTENPTPEMIKKVRGLLKEPGKEMAANSIARSIESSCNESEMPWHELIAMPEYVNQALGDFGGDPFFSELKSCALGLREKMYEDHEFAGMATALACIPGAFMTVSTAGGAMPVGAVACAGLFIAQSAFEHHDAAKLADFQVACAASGSEQCAPEILMAAIDRKNRAADAVAQSAIMALVSAESAQNALKEISAVSRSVKNGDLAFEKAINQVVKNPKAFGLTQNQAEGLLSKYAVKATSPTKGASLVEDMTKALADNLKRGSALKDEQALELAKLVHEEGGSAAAKYTKLLQQFADENAHLMAKKYQIKDVEQFVKLTQKLPPNARSLMDLEILAKDFNGAIQKSPKFGKQLMGAVYGDADQLANLERSMAHTKMPKDVLSRTLSLLRNKFQGSMEEVAAMFEKNFGGCNIK